MGKLSELPTLILECCPPDIMRDAVRTALEDKVLPRYLPACRWYSGKNQEVEKVRLDYALPIGEGEEKLFLCELRSGLGSHERCYQLPLAVVAEPDRCVDSSANRALARIRHDGGTDLLTDAMERPVFSRRILRLIAGGTTLSGTSGNICFRLLPAAVLEAEALNAEVRLISAEQSNSSTVIGGKWMLKLLRRIFPGIHPEREMGAFLTQQGYSNISPLIGEVHRESVDGEPTTLMLLQGYLDNQGDAWNWTQQRLQHLIQSAVVEPAANDASLRELERFAAILGQRVGEMHRVLARPVDDPAFGFRFSDAQDAERWTTVIRQQVCRVFDLLRHERPSTDENVKRLLRHEKILLDTVPVLAETTIGGPLIRVHGDLHLGQILVVRGDAYIIDFEGEPSRSLTERRRRNSPMKDVAGMLRSFDYAAALAMRGDLHGVAADRAQHIATHYRRISQRAFLTAHRRASEGLPHRRPSAKGSTAALTLFILEKLLYEILYEYEHRPDWFDVPLQGLIALADDGWEFMR